MTKEPKDRLKAWHGEDWHTPRGRMIRDVVYAIDTGLITTVAFLAGASVILSDSERILLAGAAQIVAGAVAIFFGAFISTKAQKDFFENQIQREKKEIEMLPEKETQEIREIFQEYGFDKDEQEAAVKRITANKELWLKFMVQEEIGISPNAIDDPLTIGTISSLSFLVGTVPAIMPYVLIHDPNLALLASAVSIMSFLFVLGVFKTRLTRIHWLRSGIETLAIGGISCGLGFLFGRIVNALIG